MTGQSKSGTTYPVGFPQFAHATVNNGEFKDLEKLWLFILTHDATLAEQLRKQSVVKKSADLSKRLIEAVRDARQKMANSRATRSKSSPPSSSSTQPKHRNPAQLHDMKLVGTKFTKQDGEELPCVSIEEFSTFCCGWMMGTRNKTGYYLNHYENEEPFDNPFVIVCRASSFDDESTESLWVSVGFAPVGTHVCTQSAVVCDILVDVDRLLVITGDGVRYPTVPAARPAQQQLGRCWCLASKALGARHLADGARYRTHDRPAELRWRGGVQRQALAAVLGGWGDDRSLRCV